MWLVPAILFLLLLQASHSRGGGSIDLQQFAAAAVNDPSIQSTFKPTTAIPTRRPTPSGPTLQPTAPISSQYQFLCDFILYSDLNFHAARGRVVGWACENGQPKSDNSDFEYCDWSGIICEDGFIVSLDLANIGIAGQIPNSISVLKQLEELILPNNRLIGPIPTSIGSLTNLRVISLHRNGLTSSIPSSITNLRNLQILSLNNNQLTSTFPSNLGVIDTLQFLRVDYNSMYVSLPQSCSNLKQLWYFQFDGNNGGKLSNVFLPNLQYLIGNSAGITSSIPSVIGLMTNLRVIEVENNVITGRIPVTFSLLTNLEIISFNTNSITRINNNIGFMQKLRKVDFQNNALGSTIPSSIGALGSLTYLDLSVNGLTGTIPNTLSSLTNLVQLYLQQNSLRGGIPKSIGYLTRLEQLIVYRNRLDGFIARQLENCSSLININLNENSLIGTLPPKLGNIRGLQTLYLGQGNKISGSLPESMSALGSLQVLRMEDNLLTSSISPSMISNWRSMMYLYLQDNYLTGTIGSLSNMVNLYLLYLENNHFTGRIRGFQYLPYLEQLHLQNNRFTGSIPRTVGHYMISYGIKDYYIQNNKFTGAIPDNLEWYLLRVADMSNNLITSMGYNFFYSAYSIRSIDVSDNLIDSPFPRLYKDPLYLVFDYLNFENNKFYSRIDFPADSGIEFRNYFSVRNNRLAGTIPATLFNSSSSTIACFDISHNKFVGNISSFIYSKSIQHFDISFNSLTGPLPSTIVASGNYQQFWANNNFFSGSLPSTFISRFANTVRSLNLANNNFDKPIPSAISRLSRLTELDVSDNQFSGTLPAMPSTLISLSAKNNSFTTLKLGFNWNTMRSLQYLDISDNVIGGYIPSVASSFNMLHFDISGNRFVGTIPSIISVLTKLTYLSTSDNPFQHQRLPRGLKSILASGNLKYLSMSNNSLIGDFNAEIGAISSTKGFQSLTYLDLSKNYFNGSLSVASGKPIITSYSNLQTLNLAYNLMAGDVSDSLCDMNSLTQLSVSGNFFNCFPGCVQSMNDNLISDIQPAQASPVCLNIENIMSTGQYPWLFQGLKKNLQPPLRYNDSGIVLTASTDANAVWSHKNAFDNNDASVWMSSYGSADLPQWIRIHFPFAVKVSQYQFLSWNSNSYYSGQNAKSWKLEGYKNGAWVLLHSKVLTLNQGNTLSTFSNLANTDLYTDYRITVIDNFGWRGSGRPALINTIKLCGDWSNENTICHDPTRQPTLSPTNAPVTTAPTQEPTPRSYPRFDNVFVNDIYYDNSFSDNALNEICQGDLILRQSEVRDHSSSDRNVLSVWCLQRTSSYQFPFIFEENMAAWVYQNKDVPHLTPESLVSHDSFNFDPFLRNVENLRSTISSSFNLSRTIESMVISGPDSVFETLIDCPRLHLEFSQSNGLKILPIAQGSGWSSGPSSIYQSVLLSSDALFNIKRKYDAELAFNISVMNSRIVQFASPLQYYLRHIRRTIVFMKGAALGGSHFISISSAKRMENKSDCIPGRSSCAYDCHSQVKSLEDPRCSFIPQNGFANSTIPRNLRHQVGWTLADVTDHVTCQLLHSSFYNYSSPTFRFNSSFDGIIPKGLSAPAKYRNFLEIIHSPNLDGFDKWFRTTISSIQINRSSLNSILDVIGSLRYDGNFFTVDKSLNFVYSKRERSIPAPGFKSNNFKNYVDAPDSDLSEWYTSRSENKPQFMFYHS